VICTGTPPALQEMLFPLIFGEAVPCPAPDKGCHIGTGSLERIGPGYGCVKGPGYG